MNGPGRDVAALVALLAMALCVPTGSPPPANAQEREPVTAQADAFPKADGYHGIWYCNQPSGDEYAYKYSGGLGTYCAKHIPLAYYAREANKTFFVYGGTAKGEQRLLEMVSYYDHETHTVPRPTILLDKGTSDAHDNPTLALDADGHVWVFASSHGRARPSYIYKSREPYSVESFELVRETNFSYPQCHYLAGRGFLFCHTLYSGGRRLYWTTSRDGVDWAEPQELAGIAQGHYQVSWWHEGKVGTAFNYHPAVGGLNWRTNLYYVESDDFGQTWRNVRGEQVQPPLREAQNPALVHDYEAEGLLVYLKDLNFDARGHPIVLYVTSRGYESGPKNDPRTWTTAHWTGEQWEISGSITSDNNYDTGCLHVETEGAWRLIGPTEPGPQRYNPGGEVAVWLSRDEGKTWEKQRQLTANSRYNHTYVRRPVNAHPGFYAFWADGHGREPSESRLYFTDRLGARVWRLPSVMTDSLQAPEPVE
ncbi:MAG: BNR-4 repeat-containing protein [Armatimonadota bacterium]